jgi:hypothetical protein
VAATSYILSRATAAAGPYTQIAVQVGLTFTDNAVAFGTTYFYMVQGTANNGLVVGPPTAATPAAGVTPVKPALTYSPPGPIVTSEAGLNATLTLTVNTTPTAAATVQITSSVPGEATVSGAGLGPAATITIPIPSGTAVGTTIVVTVHGVDDAIADGPQPYLISFVLAGGGAPWAGAAIPAINGTNTDNDSPGITFSRTAGLVTTESGGQDSFTVSLNTQPFGTITMSLTSSNTLEGTVSPASLTFTPGAGPNAWNVAHLVTLTGVDDTLLDFTIPYTIITGTLGISDVRDNAGYNFDPPDVSAANVDNEAIPALPHVWGGSGGGGGGCGLLGAEAGLILALAALRRRRRNL